MKLRTQLALTFLALTILPLGGLVAYTWHSSSRAVRGALEDEAAELASTMDAKLATAREWVSRSIENVEPIPFETLRESGDDGTGVARRIARSMGSAAPLVRSFEFIPAAEPLPPISSAQGALAPSASPAPDPAPPIPPDPPSFVIEMEAALEALEAERARQEEEGVAEDPVRFAFRTLEAIPFDLIVAQSVKAGSEGLTSAEEGLRRAEAELAARLERDDGSDRELILREQREIEAKREAIGRAQRQFRQLSEESRSVVVSQGSPSIPVVMDGAVVGAVKADLREDEILREIFLSTAAQPDEIPFAIDADGNLHSRSPQDAATLIDELGIVDLVESSEQSRIVSGDWIIATSTDRESGLIIGVARPAAEALAQVRKATLRSLGLGAVLLGICLIGILPLANHMTRDIGAVTEGAEQISRGDLDAEVSVKSRNEVGRLATVFNRMAHDLKANQQRLVEEETARREQELREQMLKSEYQRTASELEEARLFQLSMLPSGIPDHPDVEIAVEMVTATEVGGDYYDFRASDDRLVVAIGDGTGHGAKAGTMVAVIKSLFTALHDTDLRTFLREASATLRSMKLGRMAMALTLLELRGNRLRYATAGMPPILLMRKNSEGIQELSIPGAPLGTIAFDYEEQALELEHGDTLIAMTDGLPELLDQRGEPLGYERITATLLEAAPGSPHEILDALRTRAAEWGGGTPQNDDMTLLVLRYDPARS